MRDIIIKGVGLEAIWGQVIGSCVLTVVILYASARFFRENLD